MKYLSSHKVSSQSESNQSAILHKIKLPPAEYSRLVKKHKQKSSCTQLKEVENIKRGFNLTLDRMGEEGNQSEA